MKGKNRGRDAGEISDDQLESLIEESIIELKKIGYKESSFMMGECVNFAVALGRVIDSPNFLCVFGEEEDPLHCYISFNDFYWDIEGKSTMKGVERYSSEWGGTNIVDCYGYDSPCFHSLYHDDTSREIEKAIRKAMSRLC